MTDHQTVGESNTVVGHSPGRRGGRIATWVNWILAVLTIAGAAVVMIFAIGGVMSTAGCSDQACPNMGPSGIWFAVLFYGAAVVAVLTIVVSFFTAKRRAGIVVPVIGWALLIADFVILTVAFGH